MRRHHPPALILAAALLLGCSGADADDGRDGSQAERPASAGSEAAGEATDQSRIVVETNGQRWTEFECRPEVVRVFRSPSSGRIPAVPSRCSTDAPDRSTLELEVKGSLVDYATGTWTGSEIGQHVQVDFEADGVELSTRQGELGPASSLTIATWDSTGRITGELDLRLEGAGGTGSIRGPFTIAFEAR